MSLYTLDLCWIGSDQMVWTYNAAFWLQLHWILPKLWEASSWSNVGALNKKKNTVKEKKMKATDWWKAFLRPIKIWVLKNMHWGTANSNNNLQMLMKKRSYKRHHLFKFIIRSHHIPISSLESLYISLSLTAPTLI